MAESIMPEIKVVDPRAYLAPRIRKAGEVIGSIFHFLPDTPLASHGDHLPTALREEPVQYPVIDDRQPRLEFED